VPYAQQRNGQAAPGTSPRKTVRGGCYESEKEEVITTARKGFFQNVRQKNIGFRCVINP
jgi:formylglycine-generating enzyme required for sulfatase activity